MRPFTDHEQNLLTTDQWRELAHLRGEMLESLHTEMRRWEDQAIGAENQRDEALAHNKTLTNALLKLGQRFDGILDIFEQRMKARSAEFWQAERERDQAIAERDEWLAALKREQAKHLETLTALEGRIP